MGLEKRLGPSLEVSQEAQQHLLFDRGSWFGHSMLVIFWKAHVSSRTWDGIPPSFLQIFTSRNNAEKYQTKFKKKKKSRADWFYYFFRLLLFQVKMGNTAWPLVELWTTILKVKHDYEGSGSSSHKLNLPQLSMIVRSYFIILSHLWNASGA